MNLNQRDYRSLHEIGSRVSTPVVRPRRFKLIWFVLLLIGVGLVTLGVWVFGPNTPIAVSNATTYILSPLGPDGLPDYGAYLLDQSRSGVTPANNAAVPIWQASWPGGLSENDYRPMCAALGMEIPPKSHRLTNLGSEDWQLKIGQWLEDQQLDSDQTRDVIDESRRAPWTTAQYPVLAKWVEANDVVLNRLVAGVARPEYYSPSPSLLEPDSQGLVLALLPGLQGTRSVARAVQTRAMWHTGEQRALDAWRDLRAIHRLARHVSRNPSFVINHLVGIAIEGMACQGTRTMLHHATLTPEEARQILNELRAMPDLPPCSAFMKAERLMYLDTTIRLSQGTLDVPGLVFEGQESNIAINALPGWTSIDWNIVLEEGNDWYDKLDRVMSKPNRAARSIAMAEFEAELQQLIAHRSQLDTRLKAVVSRNARGRLMSNALASQMLPSIPSIVKSADRSTVQLQLTRTAAALAVFRAEHGSYPESLGQLVPAFIPALPIDIYSDKPLIYRAKDDGGYLLYSVYENGTDDGGNGYHDSIVAGEWTDDDTDESVHDESDFVVRKPIPAFRP